MTFISYAQNQEDVVLWRALHEVESGFYVDVGAADPTVDSVTKAFYERGWSGINVEPTDPSFAKLQSERLRDVNLRVAAGARAGVETLHVIEGTGLSTLHGEFAARHVAAGLASHDLIVPVLPLNQLVKSRAGRPIHFLKIDVEGAETAVLEGIDLDSIRPWIILVEAMQPNRQRQTWHLWEHLLLARGYEFAYFDGLNCFYIATERADLKKRLAVPPNVFDDYVCAAQWRLQEDLAQQSRRVSELEHRDAELEQAYALEIALVAHLRSELQEVRSSRADAATALLRYRAEIVQVRSQMAAMEMEQKRANDANSELTNEVVDIIAERMRLIDTVAALTGRLAAVHLSRSWRITWPLRAASLLLRRLLGRPPGAAVGHAGLTPLSPEQSVEVPTPTATHVQSSAQVARPEDGDTHSLDGRGSVILTRLETRRRIVSTEPTP